MALLASGLLAACTDPNPEYEKTVLQVPADTGMAVDSGLDTVSDSRVDTDGGADAAPVLDVEESLEVLADRTADLATEGPADVAADAATDLPVDATAPDGPALADATPPVELVAGLLGYWRFDEADNSRTMRDSSGRGNDGVFEGSSTGTAFVPGKFGRAFELTTPDRDFGIRVAPTVAIRGIQRYTLAAWVFRQRNAPNEYCGIISRQIDDEDGEVFNMMISKDYLKSYGPDRDSSTGSVTTASTPTQAPLNVWFHAAATFDGSRIRIYQDGVERGYDTWTDPLPQAGTPLYLATKKVINYAHPFLGALDELLLYDRALPPDAIAALARGERPPVP